MKPAAFKQQCYGLVGIILQNFIKANSEDMYLRMLHAYILHSRLNLKWKAIYEIEIILNSGANRSLQLPASSFLLTIERGIQEADRRSMEALGIDIKLLVVTQDLHVRLKDSIKEISEVFLRFWKELSKSIPNGQILHRLGFKLNELQDQLMEIKQLREQTNPNNLRSLVLIGNYVDLVMNNSEEVRKIEEKISTIKNTLQANKGYANVKKLQYYENISPSIVVASGNYSNIGIIKSFNPEVLKSLELAREQLIDQNVRILMPKIFSEFHDQ